MNTRFVVPPRALAAMLLVATALPSSAAPVTVPFELSDSRHVIVSATVNGRPGFRFLLDTGSPGTFVMPALVDALDLELESSGRILMGASGPTAAREVRLASLAIGELPARSGLATMQIPQRHTGGEPLHGIIGADWLADAIAWFDWDAGELRIVDEMPAAAHSVPLTRLVIGPPGPAGAAPRISGAPLMLLPVEILGESFEALLDTGAARSVMHPAAAERLLAIDEQLDYVAAEAVRGLNMQGVEARALAGLRVSVGDRAHAPITITVADLPLFRQGDPSRRLILGMDFLVQQDFAIDYRAAVLGFPSDGRGDGAGVGQ